MLARISVWMRLFSLALSATLALGCHKKLDDLAGDYQPAYTARRALLKEIAGKLPPPGSAQLVKAGKLSPTPVAGKDSEGNLDVLMVEQLSNPEVELGLDLRMSHGLSVALHWTGPKATPKSGRDDSGNFERTLKFGAALRYLAVVRIVKFDQPVVKNDKWGGGQVKGEVLVVDLSSKKVVASGPFTAEPAPGSFDITYKKGEDPNTVGERMLHSAVWSAARKEVKRIVEQTTGASIDLG